MINQFKKNKLVTIVALMAVMISISPSVMAAKALDKGFNKEKALGDMSAAQIRELYTKSEVSYKMINDAVPYMDVDKIEELSQEDDVLCGGCSLNTPGMSIDKIEALYKKGLINDSIMHVLHKMSVDKIEALHEKGIVSQHIISCSLVYMDVDKTKKLCKKGLVNDSFRNFINAMSTDKIAVLYEEGLVSQDMTQSFVLHEMRVGKIASLHKKGLIDLDVILQNLRYMTIDRVMLLRYNFVLDDQMIIAQADNSVVEELKMKRLIK